MAILIDQAPQDTFIRATATSTNYSTTGTDLVGEANDAVGEVNRTLIKFDLSSIPAGAIIDSAVLTLTYATDFSDSARTCSIYRVKQTVVITQATWNVYATGSSWATAGCSNTTSDRESDAIGSFTQPASPTLDTSVDITLTASKIQEMITGGAFTNNGFLLQVDTESNDAIGYHSAEATTTSYRPKLVVNYTVAGGMMAFF